MTKLCPRGKAAAKRKFKVYPSAYANAYASKICAGKIKDPSGVKRKDFRGSKAEGGLMEATARLKRQGLLRGGVARGCGRILSNRKKIEEAFKVTTPFMVKKKEDKKRMSAKKGSPDPKKKKKFPDLTGDGKVTFADILKGRGVIKGKKKKTKKKII